MLIPVLQSSLLRVVSNLFNIPAVSRAVVLIITVPAAPTNPMAVPFESSCNEVQFSWNPPPEDEQNGMTSWV